MSQPIPGPYGGPFPHKRIELVGPETPQYIFAREIGEKWRAENPGALYGMSGYLADNVTQEAFNTWIKQYRTP